MAGIEESAAIVLENVVLIRREAAGAGGVAIGVVESIVAEKREPRAHANATVHNELVLFEDAGGLILVDVVCRAEGAIVWIIGGRERCVDVPCEERVNATRVEIGDGKVCAFGELPLETDAALHRVRSAEVFIYLIEGGRSDGGLDEEILVEAIVENSPTRAKYGFRLMGLTAVDSPGDRNSRGEIGVVLNLVLRFVAQSIAERDGRQDAPFILKVQAEVPVSIGRGRVPLGDGKFARAAAGSANLVRCQALLKTLLGDLVRGQRIESERAVVAGRADVRCLVSAKTAAEFEKVLFKGQGGVVLEFVGILNIVHGALGAAAAVERAADVDRRIRAERILFGVFAMELEAGFVDGAGAKSLCIADLNGVLG